MNRRRVGLGAAATALALLPLAGCVTVHGERENVPSVQQKRAAAVLANFLTVNNRANKAYSPQDILTVESGALGATDEAGLRARHTNHPQGNPGYQPLAFSDARYLIPRQVGWPKFFVADVATNRGTDSRWLLVFRHAGPDQPWKAAFVAAVPTAQMPDFAKDKDGYAVDLGLGGTDLLVQPGQLSQTYADYLGKGGDGTFADGSSTSQVRADRAALGSTANSVTQYADQPASGGDFTPVALRTADGGAVVFFATRHQSRATFRAGYNLSLDEDTKALMTGTPKTSITRSTVADELVTVPKGGGSGKVAFLSRVVGLVSAKGE
ncbi:hypothetical protein [Streptomyces sp. NRRL F-5123]|uniref:hypothetical protein n=1 Tax=Streptomyces sp. NRRL F-5123 TaxID=1463856 RepID=UPI0004E2527B|nr:hypothetical protein [Streptomyces sp. NRRL F-5123]